MNFFFEYLANALNKELPDARLEPGIRDACLPLPETPEFLVKLVISPDIHN
jgi:hypothetical protein